MMESDKFYRCEAREVADFFKSDIQKGLSAQEAERRLQKYGRNELKVKDKSSLWKKFLEQFKDFMVLVLLAATVISCLLGEYTDAVTIFVIVLFNALLGFIQEYRAEKSIQMLKQLSAPSARVLRNGIFQIIPAKLLVPGDVLALQAGDKVSADCRLFDVKSLEIDEALLTGESVTSKKSALKIADAKAALGDRKNMAYAGTIVSRGQGCGIVCASGMHTEIGQIAKLLQNAKEEKTPLEKRLEILGKKLVYCCLGICLLIVGVGIMKGEPIFLMCMAGISLAVAAIPEGLPAIVTIALALGIQRMIKRNAIIRKLPAVETLGCVTVICSDKTGTLTKNEMTVKKIFTSSGFFELQGDGYDLGQSFAERSKKDEKLSGDLESCLKGCALCNNAELKKREIKISGHWRKKENAWSIDGDPTEGALLVAAGKYNIWRDQLEKTYRRVDEIPFESGRRMMAVLYEVSPSSFMSFVKGAPDSILKFCDAYDHDGKIRPLNKEMKEKIETAYRKMASDSLRVLAIAYKPVRRDMVGKPEEYEKHLIFAGLAGMIDPPREEVKGALDLCRQAGIRTVMITGDHPDTAVAIAKQLRMYDEMKDHVMTGNDLDQASEKELQSCLKSVRVFARVSPAHKLKIVKALKKAGHVVAMTGDGINDAPAVKEAHIGIAMGKNGTDVTKEASAMILTDDNFSTIVAAVEEGRSIYANIRKFIRYLLACNTGEVLTMFLASLVGLPMPLLPVQILWVNLVTDGLPAMALGVDRNGKEIMQKPPRRMKDGIFSHGLARKIIWRGIQIGISTVAIFAFILLTQKDIALARTMAFCTLVFSQIFHVMDCRSEEKSVFAIGFFKNKYLIAAILSSVAMQLSVIYLEFMRNIFSTVALGAEEWGLILLLSGFNFMISGVNYGFSRIKVAKRVFNK